MSKQALFAAVVLVLTAACGDRTSSPPGPTPDAAIGDDARVSTDGGGVDAPPPRRDGGPPPGDAGPIDCTPTAGSATSDAYCDGFELALIDDGSGDVEARLWGRLMPDGLPDEGCATVDSVDVLLGSETITTLPGAGVLRNRSMAPLARGPAVSEMEVRCDDDSNRFGGFGFVVRGRIDGGTYEARCADAEGGFRWPPALRVTCHENVDRQPFDFNYALVEDLGGLVYTTIDITVPHDPGGALLAVDGTVRIIPGAYSFGAAPEPFDITGLGASVSENDAPATGTYSGVYLSTMGDPFGPELCPLPEVSFDPMADPPPVMLVRFTGTGERGAFSSEAYVGMCSTHPAPP